MKLYFAWNEVKCFQMESQNNPEKWNNKLLAQDIINAFKMKMSTNQSMETILLKKDTKITQMLDQDDNMQFNKFANSK